MDLDTYAILLRLGIGAGIGFVIALTGIGTGVLGVPALTVLLSIRSLARRITRFEAEGICGVSMGMFAFLKQSVDHVASRFKLGGG